jgi:7,8-dihydropterin-6-yl-methyl-4-(beta-D-ribofuranosyl)aminobenzene 5'-phosphate synthase
MSPRLSRWAALLAVLVLATAESAAAGGRVTILYDAFGDAPGFERDWGYAALVEYAGKRILFDTGNDAQVFARNAEAAGVDLAKLDFAVISHRHLDHTAGLTHLLSVNPNLSIYVPKEAFGPFGSALPSQFYRKDEGLPDKMRYFDGHPPATLKFGSAWTGAHFMPLEDNTELAPGIHVVSMVSDRPGTRELRELSLALRTPRGLVVLVGCAHPGVEKVVEAARAIEPRVHLVIGGFHLPAAPDPEIERVASALHDVLDVERLAPGHCTGEPAFALLRKLWREGYVYAGVGSVIELP